MIERNLQKPNRKPFRETVKNMHKAGVEIELRGREKGVPEQGTKKREKKRKREGLSAALRL